MLIWLLLWLLCWLLIWLLTWLLFRLLFWIALIAAAFWLWRRLTRKKTPTAQQQGSLPMVRCAQCGVHVPQNQALQAHDRWYCSQAHLEQDSTSGGH